MTSGPHWLEYLPCSKLNPIPQPAAGPIISEKSSRGSAAHSCRYPAVTCEAVAKDSREAIWCGGPLSRLGDPEHSASLCSSSLIHQAVSCIDVPVCAP